VELARAGADIVSVHIEPDCDDTSAKLKALGRKCHGITYDLSGMEDAGPLAERIEKQYGPVNILVNNAGIQRRYPAAEFPLTEWDLMMQVQLRSVFLLCKAFGTRMLGRGTGKIINMASMLSFSGGMYVPAYAAAKGGVAQLTKALANEWAAKGVNVNAIAPGYMATEMNTALINDKERSAQILARIPAGRWGEPKDVGNVAVFLASQSSAYLHGHILCVDGGWMAR
jgi:2-deoxy-D-gluconate 3-dehydrogenase